MKATQRTTLLEQLHKEIDARFPRFGSGPDPASVVFMLRNPAAPIVTVSRDERAGPNVTPVLFVTARDGKKLMDFALSLYEASGHVIKLWHTTGGKLTYLVVPALFHMQDVREFAAVAGRLADRFAEENDGAWLCEDCVVTIQHNGRSFRAPLDAVSLPAVQA